MDDLVITIDTDWTSDKVLESCFDLLNNYKVRATFFCTGPLNIDENKLKNHELAIHPNYKNIKRLGKEIEELLKIYPQTKGIRSHSLFTFSRLYPIYKRFNLKYESNYFMYFQENIKPFLMENNILQLPIYFEDDFHLSMFENLDLKRREAFSLKNLPLKKPGLKIFAFHPIHIFINTHQWEFYQQVKKYYHQPKKLLEFRERQKQQGIRNLFEELLSYIKENKIPSKTLYEINCNWRKSHNDNS